MNIWGSGKNAKFNVECKNGNAWLSLGFQLASPDSLHHNVPPQSLPHHGRHQHRHRPKGPVRRERDRHRAELHQARLQSMAGTGTAAPARPRHPPNAASVDLPPPPHLHAVPAGPLSPPPLNAAPAGPRPTPKVKKSALGFPEHNSVDKGVPPKNSGNIITYIFCFQIFTSD